MASTAPDIDPQETQEWLDALKAVLEQEGSERAHYLLERLIDKARRSGTNLPYSATTAYINTIPPHRQDKHTGNPSMERRIRAMIRWNAIACVMRANDKAPGVGGHIASFQSAATLYDIGFNHFFRGPDHPGGGDLVFFQGHSAPGIYARAFIEGRISEQQLENFRQESTGQGVSSYPHPWLMPDFWQFPTVSMGLGPIQAIYQARYLKYLEHRGLAKTADRKVWAFLGDGETDEPESLGAITLASRENLDNLIFVVNCNLQRLDGPVRGNGKIIQELEAAFRGAGWNVLKVIWGSYWDPLLAMDNKGILKQRMEECVDGEYQNFKAKGGAYTREHFFGKYPELEDMVAAMSDNEIWRLNRGGHDPYKVFAAYSEAVKHKGQPTVILAKTVKGYGMGASGEAQNPTHSQKKMSKDDLRAFRDRFDIPIADNDLEALPFYRPAEDSPEMRYLREQREQLGGYLPSRRRRSPESLATPPLAAFQPLLEATGDREVSTTMSFVRILTTLLRDKTLGRHIVPIVPDEARTFGMEGLFRQIGIYSSAGQLYEPVDSDQLMYYREDTSGQILEEGITEAGAFSSWLAAATAYSVSGVQTIPFYIFYSMFGLQRIGDLAWAAGDSRARGFLLGATAGRTTLNGEGLQHEDGHSLILASTIPNCIAYDPTFGYELAVIIQDGLRRMVSEQEDVFYYLTVMNENYTQPAMPVGAEVGILKGLYKLREGEGSKPGKGKKKAPRVQLLGSGAILREVIAAADLLQKDWGVAADLWSATSCNELCREGQDAQRWNLLHPTETPRLPYVTACLQATEGPIIAATDYMKAYAEQIRPFIERRFVTLGTDGFGRSDSREALRYFFEVDSRFIAIAALKALADDGVIPASTVAQAIAQYGIDPAKPNPLTV